jgi:hypothetical protein
MQVGDKLPIYIQLFDYNAGKFIKATVRNDNNTQIAGSPVELSPIGSLGFYGNNTLSFPSETEYVTVEYVVYDDAGYTEVSTSEGGASDVFTLDSGGGGGASLPVGSYIIGVLDSAYPPVPPQNGLQDTIVTNSDRTLNIRLVSSPGNIPFDISSSTEVECRFLNADGTVLVVSSNDVGNPVVVTSPAAGELYCVLSSDQTALLQTGNPQPFSVVVTLPVGDIVVNFPYQLSVQAQAV